MSAALGYALLDPTHEHTGAFAQSLAAGALLAMITDAMLPETYDVGRSLRARSWRSGSRSR